MVNVKSSVGSIRCSGGEADHRNKASATGNRHPSWDKLSTQGRGGGGQLKGNRGGTESPIVKFHL